MSDKFSFQRYIILGHDLPLSEYIKGGGGGGGADHFPL